MQRILFYSALFSLIASFHRLKVFVTGVNEQVEEAITKCREKLATDPTFPPAQFLLAKILESTPGADPKEVAYISLQAGLAEDRPLKGPERHEALYRAAVIYRDLGDDRSASIAYLALLRLVNEQNIVDDVLHEAASTLLSHSQPIEHNIALSSVVEDISTKFPNSLVVKQFKGAVERVILKNPLSSYTAYADAIKLLQSSDSLELQLQSFLLASAAAREAGKSSYEQLGYLKRAENLILSQRPQRQFLSSSERNAIADVYNNFGSIYKAQSEALLAIESFRKALKWKENDGQALAQLASLDALSETVETMDQDYVRDLFDGYSGRFEEELVEILKYEGHTWVARETSNVLHDRLAERNNNSNDDDTDELNIVDIGCGTGLVGEEIKKILRFECRIIGVDLSERMVKLAASRRLQAEGPPIYEHVVQASGVEYLEQANVLSSSIDAVVAADVFIYIGNLEPILVASHRVLTDEGGVLVFSVELCSDNQGIALLPSGRFGHSKAYIEEQAKKYGFEMLIWKQGTLRKQRGEDVSGAVIILQKK